MSTRFDPRRPGAGAAFYGGHGLGNDYLVFEEGERWRAGADAVRRICDRHEGVGSDGIVVVLAPPEEPFRLRMFNPDGSEFERSGNGLRVVASWLHRTGRVETGRRFEVRVGGDVVGMTVHGRSAEGEYDVSVEMGRARVGPAAVDADPELLEGAAGEGGAHGLLGVPGPDGSTVRVAVHLVSVGNPHCVVFTDDAPTRRELERVGPALTAHRAFRSGANVQLARVASREAGGGGAVDVLVWERGAGHTTASGTSACAVAVAAVEAGRLGPGPVEIRMEGGVLRVGVDPELDVTLRGPVRPVMTGEVAAELLDG